MFKPITSLCFALLVITGCNLGSPREVRPLSVTLAVEATPASQNADACRMTITEDLNIYDLPGNWGTVIGSVSAGAQVIPLMRSDNEYYNISDVQAAPQWVRLNNARRSGDCQRLPYVDAAPPLTACSLVNDGDWKTIFNAPDGDYAARFPPAEAMPIIRREGDWYLVYVAAFETGGWVAAAVDIRERGNCDAL